MFKKFDIVIWQNATNIHIRSFDLMGSLGYSTTL